ncbi:HEPN domain-containing protein [Vreelandella populi]|uniref:HEPN domain-containing protein n=1 Tax=Vreelandella populi TaxID=2498858 RepID=A0A433L7R9_9GAMM|nr:HEPN domain-containing protein [Halomonas populi]RUR43374.1 HEPN domain-containing protein [Halomonas populi]
MPDRLLNIAARLKSMEGVEQEIEQHRIRSVVNRAYYAAFLTAREVCEEKGFQGSGSSHERIVDALLRQRSLTTLGNQLNEIKSLRHKADYNWNRPISPRDMHTALKKSRKLIDALKAL